LQRSRKRGRRWVALSECLLNLPLSDFGPGCASDAENQQFND